MPPLSYLKSFAKYFPSWPLGRRQAPMPATPEAQEALDNLLKLNLLRALLYKDPARDQATQGFSELIEHYTAFANTLAVLPEETQILLLLQEIQEDLNITSIAPSFFNKQRIAIVGSFSSGKSSFINTFFKRGAPGLPTGECITTSIPSFVMSSEDFPAGLYALSSHGVSNLNQSVSPDIEERLTHKNHFIDSLGLPLRDLLRYLVRISPELRFKAGGETMELNNLCFLDTPGYDAAGRSGSDSARDREFALQHINNANVLLWVMNIQDGGLSSSSMDFILECLQCNPELSLYVLINKADLKSPESQQDILARVDQDLQSNGIPVLGISVYSCIERQEFAFLHCSLKDFLLSQNKVFDQKAKYLTWIDHIETLYLKAFKKKEQDEQHLQNYLAYFENFCTKNDIDPPEHFEALQAQFVAKRYRAARQYIKSLCAEFKRCIQSILKGAGEEYIINLPSPPEVEALDLRSFQELEQAQAVQEEEEFTPPPHVKEANEKPLKSDEPSHTTEEEENPFWWKIWANPNPLAEKSVKELLKTGKNLNLKIWKDLNL